MMTQLIILAVAFAQAHASAAFGTVPAAVQDTLRWTVLLVGNRAGEQLVWSAGEEQIVRYRYSDRGRGPETETRIRLNDGGIPIALRTTGVDYFKNRIEETLSAEDGRLRWRNQAEQGGGTATGFYVSMNGAPLEVGLLAAALLRAPDGSLPLLPAGAARIERAGRLELSDAGRRQTVEHYRISGLGFEDLSIWLDADRTLFALVFPGWQAVIRQGWESSVPALEAEQRALAARTAAERARTLARQPAGPVAITGARVFDPRTRRVADGMTVLVRGDRIVEVGLDGAVQVPAGAEVIAAHGRMLLPGLWDMHVHIAGATDGMLHLAAGVTSVRDLANDVESLRDYAQRVERGEAIGPRIVKAGFLDGPGPFAGPTRALVDTPDEVRQWIARYDSLGYRQIKLYSSLDTALVPVAVAEAHRRRMRVSGHVPVHLTARRAVELGFDELQHANFLLLNFLGDTLDTRTPLRFTAVARHSGQLDVAADSVQDFIRLLKERDVVVDPTVAIFEGLFTARAGTISPGYAAVADRLPPNIRRGFLTGGLPVPEGMDAQHRAAFRRMLDIVAALHHAGVRLVAGTDALAGFSLHRELELYVQAGISAPEVLRIATLGAAEVAASADRLGSIEPGKLADLLLVDGDPTISISDIRNTVLVMKGGVLYEPAALFRALAIAPRPAVAPAPRGARTFLLEPTHTEWSRPAPPVARVRFETSKGPFVLELIRAWAPRGVDRFYNLVRLGFYDDTRFHRVNRNYIAQFGLHGDPAVTAAWRGHALADDPPRSQNRRGSFAFAMKGPNTRLTQIYINLADNSRNDAEPFSILGTVVEGMTVLDSLYSGYGESAGSGMRQGRQGPIEHGGNAYLDREYPRLDRILRACVIAPIRTCNELEPRVKP